MCRLYNRLSSIGLQGVYTPSGLGSIVTTHSILTVFYSIICSQSENSVQDSIDSEPISDHTLEGRSVQTWSESEMARISANIVTF